MNFFQKSIPYITFFTLIVYIAVSSVQTCQTRRIINIYDTANFYTIQSIELTRKNNEISDSLNKKAIEIADSSMRISKRIIELQDEYSKKELRAYVSIEQNTTLNNFAKNQVFSYRIWIKNRGKTPAMNVSHHSTTIRKKKITKVDYSNLAQMKHNQMPNIGTNESRTATSKTHYAFSEYYYNKIIQKEFKLHVVGHIRYYDVFGEMHSAQYCFLFDPENSTFYVTPYGNYQD